jgi:hypothetical protein
MIATIASITPNVFGAAASIAIATIAVAVTAAITAAVTKLNTYALGSNGRGAGDHSSTGDYGSDCNKGKLLKHGLSFLKVSGDNGCRHEWFRVFSNIGATRADTAFRGNDLLTLRAQSRIQASVGRMYVCARSWPGVPHPGPFPFAHHRHAVPSMGRQGKIISSVGGSSSQSAAAQAQAQAVATNQAAKATADVIKADQGALDEARQAPRKQQPSPHRPGSRRSQPD